MYGEGEGVLQIARVRREGRYSLSTDPRSQAINLLFGLYCYIILCSVQRYNTKVTAPSLYFQILSAKKL